MDSETARIEDRALQEEAAHAPQAQWGCRGPHIQRTHHSRYLLITGNANNGRGRQALSLTGVCDQASSATATTEEKAVFIVYVLFYMYYFFPGET